MKYLILIIFILAINIKCYSQNYVARYKAFYPNSKIEKIKTSDKISEKVKQKYLRVLKNNKPVYAKLFMNDTASIYFVEQQMLIDNQDFNLNISRAGKNNKFYIKNSTLFYELNINNKSYWVKHDNRDWDVKSKSKTISGFNCKLATSSNGKKITKAWFTNDVPLNYGPHKFYGLPGLIVKVETPVLTFLLEDYKTSSNNDIFNVEIDKFISESEKKEILKKGMKNIFGEN
ncbi:GLPGLI family protein [Flavobacteriaceae bacterium 14752]|uniref:GLPGLI family protein n=1 Tax=Mesohalobacter salilacus TaxID=2491711 RepID=UPI000F644120|nr:GLPGLI family protein [Flavobacteriaceae bacterium 14752]